MAAGAWRDGTAGTGEASQLGAPFTVLRAEILTEVVGREEKETKREDEGGKKRRRRGGRSKQHKVVFGCAEFSLDVQSSRIETKCQSPAFSAKV